jgi:glutamate carboxypeptidase
LAGYGQHSQEAEYVDLDSIAPRVYLFARMIVEVGRE